MKWKLLALMLWLGVVGIMILPTLAQKDYGLSATGRAAEFTQSAETTDLNKVIGKIITGLLSLLAIVFFLLAFYAGLRWLTARGEKEYIDRAKGALEGAIIGLVIVLSAYAIVRFILSRVGG